MNDDNRLGIHFGALEIPIGIQLTRQGFIAPIEEVFRWEKLADAINMVRVHGLVPDRVAQEANRRLMRKICKVAVPIEEWRAAEEAAEPC